MARALKITESLEGQKHVIALEGRLDTNTSKQLDAVASRVSAANEAADIVVDMKDCSFLSSAGLRVIAAMQKRATRGGSLRFRNVSPSAMAVFASTGFDGFLTID